VLGIALLASPAPDYATAFALLDAAQQADAALTPADPSLVARGHYGWGLALFGQGKEAEAVRQFQRAAQMDPNYGMLACTQVIGRGGLRQMTMSQLADLTPGAAKLHAAGLQSWSSGDLAGAIASLSEAIRLNPAVAVFHLDRGCAFLAQGSPDAAIADLNEAVRLKPDYAQAYYERGRARAYREAWHASAQDFTEAIRYPDELKKAKAAPLGELLACAYFNRGVAHLAEKKFDGAVRDFEVAEQRDPTLAAQVGPMAAEAHLGRGVEHLRASRWDDAEKDLAQAERLAPGLARDVQQHRGELHRRRGLERAARGEPHRALDDLRRAVAVDDRAANHEALGQTYLKACNWEKAVEHLKTAKDRDDSLLSEARPQMAEAYYGQAGDLERAGRRGEAIAKLSVAIELSPMTARYRRARGLLNYGSEAWPAAAADLRRAIVLGPELREELDPLLKQAERRRDEAR